MTRPHLALAALAGTLGLALIIGVSVGAFAISPTHVAGALLDALALPTPVTLGPDERDVVIGLRLPRVLLAATLGAALALAGAAMQAFFKNPLADPSIVGVSSGAALAVVVTSTFAPGLVAAGLGASTILALAAFLGGFGATLLVQLIARLAFRAGLAALLLAGIAINALAGATTALLIAVANETTLRSFTFWTLGSLGGATWSGVLLATVMLAVGLGVCFAAARPLDAMLLGDLDATALGIDVLRWRRGLFVLTALMTGVAVALVGIIGFVGLVIPHLARMLVGHRHGVVFPAAALLGATLLVLADLGARVFIAPAELPVGVITGLVGAPFFILLLVRGRGAIA